MPDASARFRRVAPVDACARTGRGLPAGNRSNPRPPVDPIAAALDRYLATPVGSPAARAAWRAYLALRFPVPAPAPDRPR